MHIRMNWKAKFYIGTGFVASLLCMYLLWSYNTFDGNAFLYGCMVYPIGILLFARAPVDGIIGKWVIPLYALLWTFLDWVLLNNTWNRLGQAAGEGLDAAMFVLLAQMIGNGLVFFQKVQRVLRFRLGFALMFFYPAVFVLMVILDKTGYLK